MRSRTRFGYCLILVALLCNIFFICKIQILSKTEIENFEKSIHCVTRPNDTVEFDIADYANNSKRTLYGTDQSHDKKMEVMLRKLQILNNYFNDSSIMDGIKHNSKTLTSRTDMNREQYFDNEVHKPTRSKPIALICFDDKNKVWNKK